MKLTKMHVTNFRCIEDSNEFSVGDITCLVGKNESGKTTVLQALECLNPYVAARNKYNQLRDYPRRHLGDYEERHSDEEAQVLSTEWTLHPKDVEAVEAEFGIGCLTSTEINVIKRYENTSGLWTLPLDQRKIIANLLVKSGMTATERKPLEKFDSVVELQKHVAGLANRDEKQNALLAKINSYRDGSVSRGVTDILYPRMPKFLYFSQYSRMSGDVSIEKLRVDIAAKTVSEGDQVFQAFLEFAGTSLDELVSAKQYEDLKARVEGASIKITEQVFEYWSQNQQLSIAFEIQAGQPGDPAPLNAGTVMHARVHNQLHKMTVPFSERSAGFIWFFSFLVLFAQVKKTHGNIIILLDEPGLNLHGKAQGDLLRYIKEKLLPHHQVMYSTHSPFMIPPDNLACVRTVEDVVEQIGPMRFKPHGTKVGDDVLSTDRDTVFPLQAVLGYEITQTLFIGQNTLLVEGPSDVLYLQGASAALKARARQGLDPRWTICPSGGLDKVNAFLSLFAGNKLHVAVLTDIAKGQFTKLEKLRHSELLRSGHVYTMGDFCDQDEADVEDLFHSDLLVAIFNEAYKLKGAHLLTAEKLEKANEATKRRVLKAEAYFRALPEPVPPFDHFTPANWLIQNPQALAGKDKPTETTLERFEKVFATLNALL